MLCLSRKKGESIALLDNRDRSKVLYLITVEEIHPIKRIVNRQGRVREEEVPAYFIVMKRHDGKIVSRIVLSKNDVYGVDVTVFLPYELTLSISNGSITSVDVQIDEPGQFLYIHRAEKLPYRDRPQGIINDANGNRSDYVGQSPGSGRLERAA